MVDRLSIAISDRRIYFASGCFKRGKFFVKKQSFIYISEGLVINGIAGDVKALVQIIKDHMKINGYRQNTVRLTVDTSLYSMREITLPATENSSDTISMLRHYLEGIVNVRTVRCRISYKVHKKNDSSGYADYEVYLINDSVMRFCEELAEALKLKLISVNVPKLITCTEGTMNACVKITEKTVSLSISCGMACKFSKTWYGKQIDLWLIEACKYMRLYDESTGAIGYQKIYVYGDAECDAAIDFISNTLNQPAEMLGYLDSVESKINGADRESLRDYADVFAALLADDKTTGFQRKRKDRSTVIGKVAISCAILASAFFLAKVGAEYAEVRTLKAAASEKYDYITASDNSVEISRAQEINRSIASLKIQMQTYNHMLSITEADCMKGFEIIESVEKLKRPDTSIIGIILNENGTVIRLRSASGDDAGYMIKHMRENGVCARVVSIETDRADKISYVYDIICNDGGESCE